MKALVVYFSITGHTQQAAEAIAKALDADLERIEAMKLPRGGTLGLFLFGGFAASRKRAWVAKPAVRKLSDYDLIIVGTPVWAWSLNPVVRGWLEINSIPAAKPYAVFATMGGAGAPNAFAEIAALAGRAPLATMAISDTDRKSGEDARLIERFVAEIRVAKTSIEA